MKLCDFGLAAVSDVQEPLFQGIFGTSPFMAPEMLAGIGNALGRELQKWSTRFGNMGPKPARVPTLGRNRPHVARIR